MILSPSPVQQFFGNNGRPLDGGLLFTYVAGTSTKIATYTDESGGSLNTNPIVLDFRGECRLWLDPTLTYKFVLSPSGDSDPPTSPIWTVDEVSGLGGLTQQVIGQILWPRSASEIAASVTPANYGHPWGSWLRYGADPSGLSDSHAAISSAISCNDFSFDDYPGGGSYLLNNEVVIDSYPCRIQGGAANPNITSGTIITLATVAGSGAAAFRVADNKPNITFSDITVKFQTTTTGQIGFRFGSDSRYCRMTRCAVMGAGGVASTCVGLQLDTGGTFTGHFVADQCYISGCKYGIDIQGTVTILDIFATTFIGYTTSNSSYGIKCSNLSTYSINGGHIEGFNTTSSRGIYSEGAYMRQENIRYEVNTVNWEWVRGSGNPRIYGMSSNEAMISGGDPIYPLNDTDACMVLTGPGFCDIDTTDLSVWRGYYEGGRTERLGNYNAIPFSAGNFQANGGGTWALTSPDQVTYLYRLMANSVDVIGVFRLTTITGSPTQLILTLPKTATNDATATCLVNNAGTRVIAYATVVSGSNLLAIQLVGGGAFTAGTDNSDVELQISVKS